MLGSCVLLYIRLIGDLILNLIENLIGEKFVKKCISKLRKCSKKELKFILMYDTKKVAFFCSNKDPVHVNLQSHVIY